MRERSGSSAILRLSPLLRHPAALAGLGGLMLGGVAATMGAFGPFGHAQRPADEDVIVAMVARDGPVPTPTPTPTPLPPPPVASHCYQPRPSAGEWIYFPAGEQSLFQNCQVVQYYGYPRVPVLGILGEFAEPATAAQALVDLAATFDSVNGPRGAIGAFHIIAAVAQASAGADGTYLSRIPFETIDEYLAVAEAYDLLVFLDLQIGRSTVEAEVERVRGYLEHPRVHLALDPEWTMPPGLEPGDAIGSMDAAQINYAQGVLQEIVERTGQRSKVLVVHQFTESMITNKAAIADYAGVDLVIDMDGFGGRGIKLEHYQRFVVEDGAEHGGMKLFFDEDVNMFTPAEVSSIWPQPDIVQYQ